MMLRYRKYFPFARREADECYCLTFKFLQYPLFHVQIWIFYRSRNPGFSETRWAYFDLFAITYRHSADFGNQRQVFTLAAKDHFKAPIRLINDLQQFRETTNIAVIRYEPVLPSWAYEGVTLHFLVVNSMGMTPNMKSPYEKR